MSDIRYFGSQSDFTEILFITIYHLLLFLYY
jgi:hypothetical protein